MPDNNGQPAPGPRPRPRFNSLRHGLTARSILLPGESEEEWLRLRDDYLLAWLPVGPAETSATLRLAELAWRLARVATAERAATLERQASPNYYESPRFQLPNRMPYRAPTEYPETLPRGMPAASAMRPLIRHEAHLWRQTRVARAELEALQARRLKAHPGLECDPFDLPLCNATRAELGLVCESSPSPA